MKRVFFDASVIFSAMYSKTGGSFRLVGLAKEKKTVAITSQTVILELKDNLSKLKIKNFPVESFIAKNNFLVREEVSEEELKPFIDLVHIKDAHLLAGAVSTQSQYLVTLDKKHLDNPTVKRRVKDILNIEIISPKKLLGLF